MILCFFHFCQSFSAKLLKNMYPSSNLNQPIYLRTSYPENYFFRMPASKSVRKFNDSKKIGKTPISITIWNSCEIRIRAVKEYKFIYITERNDNVGQEKSTT